MLTFKLHVHCRGMGNHIYWQPTCLILEVLYIILWLTCLKNFLSKLFKCSCLWFFKKNSHGKYTAAAAAASLQSCPTLCDPIDSSPPGSPIPGILQARTLEWVAISFSNAWQLKVKVKSLSCVQLLGAPWTAAHQAPPSMGFSRQEYWSGVPLPSPGKYATHFQIKFRDTMALVVGSCFDRARVRSPSHVSGAVCPSFLENCISPGGWSRRWAALLLRPALETQSSAYLDGWMLRV